MRINIIHLKNRVDRFVILKKELDEHQISDYVLWDGIVDSNIVEKGISKSHKRIIEHAKKNELKEVLIAEDDLKFTGRGAFDFFLTQKPLDFDIYLASIYMGNISEENIVKDFSGLTFYIVSNKFYDKFLQVPEHDNLDRMLCNRGKFVVCNPFTVIQQNGYSDNKKMYCDNDVFLKGRKLFMGSI